MTQLPNALRFAVIICLPFGALLESKGQGGPAVEIYRSEASTGGAVPVPTLPVHVSISAFAGYDENANTSASNEQGSFYETTTLSLSYAFGTSRTHANLASSAGGSYYPDRDGVEFDPNINLQLSVLHEVSERLIVSGNLVGKYAIEPDFTIDAGRNRRSGNYLYALAGLSASYQWLERFSTVSSYSFATIQYDETVIGDFQNRVEHGFAQQFRFLLLPVTTLVTEYRLGLARYDTVARDSETNSLLLGFDHSIGPRLQGSFRAGAEFRSSESGSGDGVNPYVDGSLSFVVGDKTSLNWNARYSTEESNLIESPSRESFNTGLSVRYGFTPRISSNLSFFYRYDQYAGGQSVFIPQPSFAEDSVDLGFDLQYAINERISASAGYHRTEILSDAAQRSYSRGRYFGGLTFSF